MEIPGGFEVMVDPSISDNVIIAVRVDGTIRYFHFTGNTAIDFARHILAAVVASLTKQRPNW